MQITFVCRELNTSSYIFGEFFTSAIDFNFSLWLVTPLHPKLRPSCYTDFKSDFKYYNILIHS